MYSEWIRPLLFRLQSDKAHDLALSIGAGLCRSPHLLRRLDAGIGPLVHPLAHEACSTMPNPLAVRILGLEFRTPIGLAAGFDKNARIVPLIDVLGFGHMEVGSITANPSQGNPKPRSFRLPADKSLINRMGLNNDGAYAVVERLRRVLEEDIGDRSIRPFPIGVNIAKTHDPSILGEAAILDYLHSFELARTVADYVTINISCPNTAEGKTFEEPGALSALLGRLLDPVAGSPTASHPGTVSGAHRPESGAIRRPPVLVKFSPDLDDALLRELLSVTESHAVDGYVATNTSSTRNGLRTDPSEVLAMGRGGLSGASIRAKSLRTIGRISDVTQGTKPIIGVGGISTADDILDAMKAGASLVQMYTGLIYEGPFLARRISEELLRRLQARNLASLADLVWSA